MIWITLNAPGNSSGPTYYPERNQVTFYRHDRSRGGWISIQKPLLRKTEILLYMAARANVSETRQIQKTLVSSRPAAQFTTLHIIHQWSCHDYVTLNEQFIDWEKLHDARFLSTVDRHFWVVEIDWTSTMTSSVLQKCPHAIAIDRKPQGNPTANPWLTFSPLSSAF